MKGDDLLEMAVVDLSRSHPELAKRKPVWGHGWWSKGPDDLGPHEVIAADQVPGQDKPTFPHHIFG
jgi:hypothetical protein